MEAAATISFKFLEVMRWVLSQVIIIEIKNPSMRYYSWREGVMNATHSQGITYSLTITNTYVNTVNHHLLCSRQGRLKAYLYYSGNTALSYSYFLPD